MSNGTLGSGLSTPEEVIDTATWTPSTSKGVAERLGEARKTLLSLGLLGLAGAGVVIALATEFAVAFLTATPTIVGALLVITGVLAYLSGLKNGRGEVNDSAWLVCNMPDGVLAFVGEIATAPDGSDVFVPYRGFDEVSGKSRPLKLDELGGGMDRTRAKAHRGDDAVARVRLDDARVNVRDTAYGTVVAAVTDGLAADPHGRHSDCYLRPPSDVEHDIVGDLSEAYEGLTSEVEHLQDQLDAERRRNAELRHRLNQADEDVLDRFVDRVGNMQEILAAGAGAPRGRRRSAPSGDGDGEDPSEDAGMPLDEAASTVANGAPVGEEAAAKNGGAH